MILEVAKRLHTDRLDLPSTPEPFRFSSFLSSLVFIPFLFNSPDPSSDAHLLGQHTIRMSPISTAQLNPYAHTFCLSPHTGNNVLIPILLNNTDVANVRYTVTPLGYVEGESGTGKIEYVELNAKDLKAIELARVEGLQVARTTMNSSLGVDDDDYDEYDDDEDEKDNFQASHSTLQKTQSLTHIRLKKPGTVRIERVLDTSNIAARLSHPLEVAVVPCPQAQFAPEKLENIRCAGQDPDLQLTIDINGVPPLSLRWFKEVNGKKEHFLVEGIEGSHDHRPHHPDSSSELPLVNVRRTTRVSKDLKVPLSVSLDAIGKHKYVLEEIIDGVGNTVLVSLSYYPTERDLESRTTRSFSVLRRPSMFFKNCGPGNPTSLLIDSEAFLTIQGNSLDRLDAPWDVSIKYEPPADLEKGGGKKLKPWKKTMKWPTVEKELDLKAIAPGEYTILSVKGKVKKYFDCTC